MKKIKRRLICLLLCVCMCSSLFVYAGAIEPLDGTIDADDDATLIKPTLEVSTTPTGAIAVGYDMWTGDTYYYRVNADILSLNPNVSTFIEPGWMPDIENAVSLNHIIGDSDEREMVDAASMSQNPHRAVALLDIWYWDDVEKEYVFGKGTATMISPNVALTAAHCIYDKDCGWPITLTVSPGVYGSASSPTRPFGMAYAEEVIVSVPYYETPKEDKEIWGKYDWAVILLSDPIGNESGYLGFECAAGSIVTTTETPYSVISGYPSDKNELGEIWVTYNQYYAVDEITQDFSGQMVFNGTAHEYRTLNHTIDTEMGQSGAAILYPKLLPAVTYVIRGVHTRGINHTFNVAVGITGQMYSFMLAYKNLHLND